MKATINPRRLTSMLADPFTLSGRDMNEWFDRMFDFPNGTRTQGGWIPAATVWEDAQHYHVDLELPGVTNENVEVTFEEGRLLVTAKRPQPEQEHRYYHNERGWGETTRAFRLPESVDAASIEAKLEHGVLSVSLAKRAEVLPRKIEVKAT